MSAGGQHGAGVARRDDGPGAARLHLPTCHHHGGVRLGAHGLDAILGRVDAVGGVDDLDVAGHVTVLGERALEGGLVAHKQDVNALARGLHGTGHGNERCLVAAHRIDGDDDIPHRDQAPVSTTARPL